MTKRLTQTVHVADDEHSSTAFAPGTPQSDLPAWALAKIGAHAFYDDGDEPEVTEPEVVVPFGAPHPEAKPETAEVDVKAKSKSAKGADSK